MQPPHRFRFLGRGPEFFDIWFVNILLSIITLGIYSAWAKVRTQRYFYGNTELDGDRFDYLATPLQILKGRVVAVVLLVLWAVLNAAQPVAGGVVFLAAVLLLPVVLVASLRFNMRVTRYRNINFRFMGGLPEAYTAFLLRPAAAYAVLFGIAAVPFSISEDIRWHGAGIAAALLAATPLLAWAAAGSARYIVNNTWYGNLPFAAEVATQKYTAVFAMTALISVGLLLILAALAGVFYFLVGFDALNPAIGFALGYVVFIVAAIIASAFYQAQIRNYLFGQTSLDDFLRLESAVKPGALAMLMLTNTLLFVVSMGMAMPHIHIRNARFFADATALSGDLSLTHARHEAAGKSSALGEEVGSAFDLDIDLV